MAFKKVYAINPNPALDLNGEVEEILPNEKNYIENESRFPGGNAINAARILSRLNLPVKITGFLGGPTGDQLDHLLKTEEMKTDFIHIANDTRINITVSNQSSHNQTRFSFPGPSISKPEKLNLLKKTRIQNSESLFLLGGSFPENFSVADAKAILKIAHQKKIATIVDVPSVHLKKLLRSKPLMIKPNLTEFEQLVGKKLTGLNQILLEARKLLKFCPIICISSVEKGVLLITKKSTYLANGPRITAKSSVGAGDSLVGGIAAGLIQEGFGYEMFFVQHGKKPKHEITYDSWRRIMSTGMGAALATISVSGTQLGSKKDILKFAKKIQLQEIKS